ncbi:ribonuclease P 40kDa subunit-domain-containing protein [Amanita rubescens]|nr:ribonuclease P 40kDa subunit-domain-containing protein [Amanita rubescens]
MYMNDYEHSRVKVTPGAFTSNKLSLLANCHPFTRRLEVIFPENPALETTLTQHKTCYAKGTFKLSELVENPSAFIHTLETQSNFLMLSRDKNIDDVWCIDSRGIVTLFLSKDTYEQLGIVGKPLPFKKRLKHERVVQFSLRRGTDTPGIVARRHVALKAWDKRREEEMGLGGWNVIYCCRELGTILHPLSSSIEQSDIMNIKAQVQKIRNVRVPDVELRQFPEREAEDDIEDWNEEIHSLFEWVGMACLGAQRLKINDRVDPYVALYKPPPSTPGCLTHIRWQGLICPAFVQLVINTTISCLNTNEAEHAPPFVAVVSHSVTNTPLSYISPKNTSLVPSRSETLRIPTEEGEDSWSLYMRAKSGLREGQGVDWVLAESVDKLDTRWG